MEKENPNLITVFICFLRSGLRFTRYDTNNVGLAFIEEIKKHNPNFKPEKVQQRERDQFYTVNAYPKEFEQLILSLIEEYRKKHKLEYRLKKPRSGGFNRGGGSRQGGSYQSRDQRGAGGFPRPRRDDQRGGYTPREGGDNREGSRPRRNLEPRPGQDSDRPRGIRDESRGQGEGEYKPRPNPGYNRTDGDSAPIPNPKDKNDEPESRRPRRPRRDET